LRPSRTSARMIQMGIVRVAVACALLVAVSGEQLSACAGWNSSAAARMECCERTHCDDPALAAQCCAGGERNDHAQVNIALPGPTLDLACDLMQPAARLSPRPFAGICPPAPHAFRNAVLLI
jgi:hypothetical protein